MPSSHRQRKQPRDREPGQRQLRIGELLRRGLAGILERGEVRDPELGDVPITVTEVGLSPDLKNATAYVMPLGGGEATEVMAALNRAAPYMRHRLASEVSLKFAPALKFELDPSFEYAGRIERILRSPLVARDIAAESEETPFVEPLNDEDG